MNTRNDVLTFINSRKWERKWSLKGDEYVAFPNLGVQPVNVLGNIAQSGLHWWFWEKCFIDELKLEEKIMKKICKYSITFNCLAAASIRKLNYDEIRECYPNLDEHLAYHSNQPALELCNVETLAIVNSTEQIERAIAVLDILKIKLNKAGSFDLSSSSEVVEPVERRKSKDSEKPSWNSEDSESSKPSKLPKLPKPRKSSLSKRKGSVEKHVDFGSEDTEPSENIKILETNRPKVSRTTSAYEMRKIEEFLNSIDSTEHEPEPPKQHGFFKKLSPHFTRKNKQSKK